MKVIYFDCFSGVAGDMILGALLDTGLISLPVLKEELSKLNLYGYELSSRKVVKQGIAGTKADVEIPKNDKHNHNHNHKGLAEIQKLIQDSSLNADIKKRALCIFDNLAVAEGKVHNISKDEVHFHEVGAVDSIVDVVGSVIGLHLLGVEKIYSSPIQLGRGFINCAHGTIPVPAPATLELAKNVPVYSRGVDKELATPTGMAIIATLCDSFDNLPAFLPIETGYGAGNSDLPHPNLLRVIIGKEEGKKANEDHVAVIEANLDDMVPEYYGHFMDLCFEAGALDVYFTPVQMKKNRPGTEIKVLAPIHKSSLIKEVFFKHTTTLGVRSYCVKRDKLERQRITIDTTIGKARIKISFKNQTIYTYTPEYEDVKTLAEKTNKPLKEINSMIIKEFLDQEDRLLKDHCLQLGQ